MYEHMNRALRALWCFLIVMPACLTGWTAEEKVLYENESLYHHIRVSEVDGYRYLSFNRMRGNQSAVNVNDPYELKFSYTRASFVAPAFLDREPQSILFVGLGGGSVPRVMAKHYPNAEIDIVEIDPSVVQVAKLYFFFEPTPNMNVFTMDGRRFLRKKPKRYDMIFLDAYDDRSIPFHLTTKEFFEIVKENLTPDGVVAANVWGPRTDQFYLSEVKTYQQVFNHVHSIDAINSNNYILIAHNQNEGMTKAKLIDRIPSLQMRFQFDFSLQAYARTFEDLTYKKIDADVLIDDYAPVNVLRARKANP